MKISDIGKAPITTLHELFISQLRILYSSEKQLVEALPRMVEAARDSDLKTGFTMHYHETREHVHRLEEIFLKLAEDPEGKTCHAMIGLIKESKEVIDEWANQEVKDAALITVAQQIEHYEIAGYGAVRSYANLLEHFEAADWLQATLDEEAVTDKKLIAASRKINPRVPSCHHRGRLHLKSDVISL